MIELLIVFMELVIMAVSAVAWSLVRTLALVLTIMAYRLSKVIQLIVDLIVRQVDRFVKDAMDVPGLDNPKLDNQVLVDRGL
jgi:hypothetical protein